MIENLVGFDAFPVFFSVVTFTWPGWGCCTSRWPRCAGVFVAIVAAAKDGAPCSVFVFEEDPPVVTATLPDPASCDDPSPIAAAEEALPMRRDCGYSCAVPKMPAPLAVAAAADWWLLPLLSRSPDRRPLDLLPGARGTRWEPYSIYETYQGRSHSIYRILTIIKHLPLVIKHFGRLKS